MAGNYITDRLDKLDELMDEIAHRVETVEDINKHIKQAPVIYGYQGKRFDLNDNLDVVKLLGRLDSAEGDITQNITNITNSGGDISAISLSNQPAVATSNIDANSQKIINVAAPVSGGDAGNKTYIDGVVAVNAAAIVINAAAIAVNVAAIALNTTHRTSDGSNHSFIDQSVVSGASPTFDGTNFTGIPSAAVTNNVSATVNITDHAIVRGHGGAKVVQTSGIIIDDSNNVSSMGTLGCGAITSTGAIVDGAASTFTTGSTIGNLTLANGSITDSSGAISFGNENLSTTGTFGCGVATMAANTNIGDLIFGNGSITSASATIDFDENNLSTIGSITGNSFITAQNIGIAADTDIISITGANLLKINGNIGIAGGNPLAQAGMNLTFAYTGTANCYGFYESFTWTPTSAGGSIFGGNLIASIAGTQNIQYGYSFHNRFNLSGSGAILQSLFTYRGEMKANNTTRTISGNMYLSYSATTLVGSKVTVAGLAAQLWLEDYTDVFTVSGVNYGIVQIGSSLINHIEGEIRIDTDSTPLNLGEGQDYGILYDGTNAYHRMKTGTGQFIFDTFTDIDQDCQVLLKAGEAKSVSLWLYTDEGDDNADKWRIYADNSDNNIKIQTYATGAFVSAIQFTTGGNVLLPTIKNGATQGAAGAAATEVWKTNGHATLPDNVLMVGV